jgi:hypothetical protein
LNCYRICALSDKTERSPSATLACAFEKGVNGLKRDLEAVLESESFGYDFPRVLGQSPLLDLI